MGNLKQPICFHVSKVVVGVQLRQVIAYAHQPKKPSLKFEDQDMALMTTPNPELTLINFTE